MFKQFNMNKFIAFGKKVKQWGNSGGIPMSKEFVGKNVLVVVLNDKHRDG